MKTSSHHLTYLNFSFDWRGANDSFQDTVCAGDSPDVPVGERGRGCLTLALHLVRVAAEFVVVAVVAVVAVVVVVVVVVAGSLMQEALEQVVAAQKAVVDLAETVLAAEAVLAAETVLVAEAVLAAEAALVAPPWVLRVLAPAADSDWPVRSWC